VATPERTGGGAVQEIGSYSLRHNLAQDVRRDDDNTIRATIRRESHPTMPPCMKGAVPDVSASTSQILLEALQEPYDGDDYTGLNYHKFVSNALLRGAARSAVGKQPKFDGTIIRSESELQLLKCLGAEEDPFGLALNVIGGASPHIPTTCHEESWWEPLMHRYIIFYALSAKVLSCKEEDIGDDLVKCLLCSTKVIMELLETEVAQSHPQEAESLSRRIRTFTQIAESR